MICRCHHCQITLKELTLNLRPVGMSVLEEKEQLAPPEFLNSQERLKRLKELHKCKQVTTTLSQISWDKLDGTLDDLRTLVIHYENTGNIHLVPIRKALRYLEKIYDLAEACNFQF